MTRDAIPKPPEAYWFVVWECDNKIYEEEIPDPPEVYLTATEPQMDGVRINWESNPGDGLWYLVHWKDVKGVYRGVAPRLTDKSLLLPRSLFARGRELSVRIYATSGIATGFAEQVIRLDQYTPSGITFTLATVESKEESVGSLPWVLPVLVTDAAGSQFSDERITWYDARGNRLALGAEVDLRTLPLGRHVIRAVARGYGGSTAAKSWLIERKREGCVLYNEFIDKYPKPPKDITRYRRKSQMRRED